ncbi:hypothetical protein SAMN05216377_114158 [Pseudonocardia oroxyli]|uniref:Uncharacterized protein n=1 Tax=Pseudonocardia oroxyli TaxID=366584 RepID=A0A1G7WKA4_PSEOR|nr:hypothetical protein SAMN05216377_114158 [Pseudonocardia oroxyli]
MGHVEPTLQLVQLVAPVLRLRIGVVGVARALGFFGRLLGAHHRGGYPRRGGLRVRYAEGRVVIAESFASPYSSRNAGSRVVRANSR